MQPRRSRRYGTNKPKRSTSTKQHPTQIVQTFLQLFAAGHGAVIILSTSVAALLSLSVTRDWIQIISYGLALLMVLTSVCYVYFREPRNRRRVPWLFRNTYTFLAYFSACSAVVVGLVGIWFVRDYTIQFYTTSSSAIALLERVLQRRIAITVSVVMICAGIPAIVGVVGFLRHKLSRKALVFTLSFSLVLGIGSVCLYQQRSLLQRMIYEDTFYHTMRAWNQGQYATAEAQFDHLHKIDPAGSTADEALGYKAGAQYHQEHYAAAVWTSAELLYHYPHADDRAAHVQTLHWSIYGLGQTAHVDDAVAIITEVQQAYPVPEISALWLGMSPEAHFEVQATKKPPWSAVLDQTLLNTLIQQFPDDPYSDYALFMVRRYDDIITYYPEAPSIDLALYNKGRESYFNGHYREAIEVLQDFLTRFPDHAWGSDDAAYLMGNAYRHLQDREQAVHWLAQSLELGDQTVQGQAEREIMKLIVGLSVDELTDLQSTLQQPGMVELLEYVKAVQYLVDAHYVEALHAFESVCTQPQSSRIAIHCPQQIAQAQQLHTLQQNTHTDAGLLQMASFLFEEYDIFWMKLYNNDRYVDAASEQGLSFFEERNAYLQAVAYANIMTEQFPTSPLLAEAYCLIGDSYQAVSEHDSFLPYESQSQSEGLISSKPFTETIRFSYRERAVTAYHECARLTHDQEQKAYAYIESALLHLNNPWDFARARDGFHVFINELPHHHLANNAQIWIARTYLMESRRYGANDPRKQPTLQQAAEAYQIVLRDYPEGHVGAEARDELAHVQALGQETP